MFVEPRDLVAELSGAGGESFESFMRSLIEAEGATHGITPIDIDWDYRVNCPDAGCDIFIKKGHAQDNPRFIPAVPSIWSFKGGKDGTKAAKLRTELSDGAHDRLRQHLRDGGAYVWCALQPISQPARQKMCAEVQKLAKALIPTRSSFAGITRWRPFLTRTPT